ncbi:hypothetical protein FCV25MIE_02027 [Fagus crenata]
MAGGLYFPWTPPSLILITPTSDQSPNSEVGDVVYANTGLGMELTEASWAEIPDISIQPVLWNQMVPWYAFYPAPKKGQREVLRSQHCKLASPTPLAIASLNPGYVEKYHLTM